MNPRILNWNELDDQARAEALERPRAEMAGLRESVAEIIRQVRNEGDNALAELTRRFDGHAPAQLQVDPSAIEQAGDGCSKNLMRAIRDAEQRIRKFHAIDLPRNAEVETAPGLRCEVRYQPIDAVGLYIPGGSAPLVSTVLMLGVPAGLAGCRNAVLCTPPGPGGAVAPEILAAAGVCGIEQVFAVGGAQAIAAMAYGTESIPRCAKIFGPGNAWVTEAKQQVSLDPEGAAIDLPAGPSELLVIADDSADVAAVAWDLLSQAEHGPDSQVILLTDSEDVARAAGEALIRQANGLPRGEILETSLAAARIIVTASLDEAIGIANRYAPEHLIINAQDARRLAARARNAGSIFVGPWTPESLGDYCSGTNHVLPTYGWARACNALSVADFMRRYTLQEASLDALELVGPTAEALAASEGLDAHRMAVRHRLQSRASS